MPLGRSSMLTGTGSGGVPACAASGMAGAGEAGCVSAAAGLAVAASQQVISAPAATERKTPAARPAAPLRTSHSGTSPVQARAWKR